MSAPDVVAYLDAARIMDSDRRLEYLDLVLELDREHRELVARASQEQS